MVMLHKSNIAKSVFIAALLVVAIIAAIAFGLARSTDNGPPVAKPVSNKYTGQ